MWIEHVTMEGNKVTQSWQWVEAPHVVLRVIELAGLPAMLRPQA